MKKAQLFLNLVGTKCAKCGAGRLAAKQVTYDLGPVLGMTSVKVENLPVLACPKCDNVTITGPVVEGMSTLLAVAILKNPDLGWMEVRYLRRMLGDTQEGFAQKLSVDRVTVSRWENSKEPITGITSEAIRLHAFTRLRPRNSIFESLAEELTATKRRAPPRRAGYHLDGASLTQRRAA
jgi:hypothetical protein